MRDRNERGRVLRIGNRTFLTHGMPQTAWRDLYHRAMTVSWPIFFLSFAVLFLFLNTIYAILYALGDHPIANTTEGFEGLFYFSIETLATVGYGDMHPQTRYGHLVATVEIFTGMSIIAVMTGLVFARFSRPRAMVLFATHAVVAMMDGQPTLMVRMANARHNMVSNATAKFWLTRNEHTEDGRWMRRFHELILLRSENPVFALSWTIFHIIDESSPLFGYDQESFDAVDASLIVTLMGLDETSGQMISARQGYTNVDVRLNHRYADILTNDESGTPHIDYRKFHETVQE